MAKSPLILAALAKAACPQLDFHEVKSLSANSNGAFDTALLTSTTGEHYVVRVANSQAAGAEQEVELRALKALVATDRMRLPFKITTLIGETKDDRGSRVLVYEFLYGTPTDVGSVAPGSALATSIARSIAAIHNLDTAIIENAHLASFEPAEIVRTRVAELDRMAATGKVPSVLLSRWEAALEDVSMFRFKPCVIHGGLSGDSVLSLEKEVAAILNWNSLRISDPAEDFAWIFGAGFHDLNDNIIDVYLQNHDGVDPSLKSRATLYAELEIGRWLLHGVTKNDQDVIDDAVSMLEVLAEDVASGAIARLTAAPISTPKVIEAEIPTESDLF